jgi:hypothetical protein
MSWSRSSKTNWTFRPCGALQIYRASESINIESLKGLSGGSLPENEGEWKARRKLGCGRRNRTFIFGFKARRVAGYTIPQLDRSKVSSPMSKVCLSIMTLDF